MVDPGIALLMPNFNAVSSPKRKTFLNEIDRIVPKGTLILLDGKNMQYNDSFENLKLVMFSHSKDIGNTLRTGMAAALDLGAEKIITFESYSAQNARWFLPYLDVGNVIESKKRSFMEMAVTEITNIFSFCNAYNGFSMNRIFTKEAAVVIKGTRRGGRAFLVESTDALNQKGIKTLEVIKGGERLKAKKALKPKEVFSSVMGGFNRFSVLFSVFGILTYIVNVAAVYISLSIGWFYPVAVFLGGELSAVSNFIMNEKINFKNRGFLNSAYRLGKFNGLAMIPIVFDIFFIGYLTSYTDILGKALVNDLSIISLVLVSTVSFIIITKLMWRKDNHVRVAA